MFAVTTWTPERTELLREMWDAGKTARQIAKDIGGFESHDDGGRNAILGKSHRLKLPPRRVNHTDIAEMRTRREARRVADIEGRRMRHQNAKDAGVIRKPSAWNGGGAAPKNKPKAAEPFIGSLEIPFNDLRSWSGIDANQCRYIEGDCAPFAACGNTTEPGRSYCGHHHSIVCYNAYQITDADRERRRQTGVRLSPSFFVPTSIRCSDADDALGTSSI